MNKNRKGFTIVELVIVIAIIAILAAVLIPTFASLIAKANVSADTQLVRNLNTALTTEKAGGENNKTMNDALKMAKNAGYDIDRIVSKSGNNIGWDSKNDRFVLIDANNDTYIYPTDAGSNAQKIQNAVDYFVISKTIPETAKQKYSIYLSEDATLADGTVTVSVGFDAGENTNVKTVNYTSDATQDVIIRTNSTNTVLTVTAKNSTVKHYDVAGKVLINEVASKSYHEFGEVVGNLQIFKGRLELTSSANVSTVLVSSAAANDVKVEVVNGAQVGTVAPTTDNAKTDVAAATTIPAEAKQTEKVTPNTDFAGGLGTERSPYLIANKAQLMAANDAFTTNNKVYFKQVADIVIDRTWSAVKLYGEYDGNNYTVTMDGTKGTASVVAIFVAEAQAAVSNLKIVSDETCLLAAIEYDAAKIDGVEKQTIYISGITSTVKDGKTINVYESNAGFLVYSHVWNRLNQPVEVVLKNCTVNASAKSSAACLGGFIGGTIYFAYPYGNTLEVSDCTFKGNLYGQQVGLIFGNGTDKYNDDLLGEDYKLTEDQLKAISTKTKDDGTLEFGNLFFNGMIPQDSTNKGTFASIFANGNAKLKTLSEKYTAWANNNLKDDELAAYLKEIGLLDKIKLSNIDASEALFNGTTGVGVFSRRFDWNDQRKIDTMAQALLEAYYRSNVKGNYTTINVLKDQGKVEISVDADGNFYLNTASFNYNDQYTYKILVSISGVGICKNSDLSDNGKSLNGRSFVASLSTSGFDANKKWKAGNSFAYNETNAKTCGINAVASAKIGDNDPIFENTFRYKIVVDNNNYYIVLADTSVSGNEYSQPWFTISENNNDITKAKISLTLVAYENGVIVGSTGIN